MAFAGFRVLQYQESTKTQKTSLFGFCCQDGQSYNKGGVLREIVAKGSCLLTAVVVLSQVVV